jgi:nucleoside-diphosphate kinase
METTLVMLKPDALERDLVDKIIRILQDDGVEIVRFKKVTVEKSRILKHYKDVIKRINKPSFKQNVLDMFVGKDVLVYEMKTRDEDVIMYIRNKIGATDPVLAKENTIRGQFGNDSLALANKENRMLKNLIHASDSVENAKKEIALWFDK